MAGKNNDWRTINGTLGEFLNLYKCVISEISNNFGPGQGQQDNIPKKNISANTFKKYLVGLGQAVINYDSETAIKIIKELKMCNLPERFYNSVIECEKAMEDYDYDKVEQIVKSILNYV